MKLPRDIQSMSTEQLQAFHEAIAAELDDREQSWYSDVMENPVAYTERVTNPTPFEDDKSYKSHLHDCVRNDPDYFERPEPRCG